MIILNNIHVTFERPVLKGLSLQIHKRDFITVLGSNGAGKSTLLSVLAGEIQPSQGSIEGLSRVARVFQDPLAGTCGNLTIAENLALAQERGKKRTLSRAITRVNLENYQTLLKPLGLHDRLDALVSTLSGGQRQVVSLLMATLSPCDILLLDEHTAALDPKMAHLVMSMTNEIAAREKFPILMITHNLQDALSYGNRTIILHDGKIVCDLNQDERARLSVQNLCEKMTGKHM